MSEENLSVRYIRTIKKKMGTRPVAKLGSPNHVLWLSFKQVRHAFFSLAAGGSSCLYCMTMKAEKVFLN